MKACWIVPLTSLCMSFCANDPQRGRSSRSSDVGAANALSFQVTFVDYKYHDDTHSFVETQEEAVILPAYPNPIPLSIDDTHGYVDLTDFTKSELTTENVTFLSIAGNGFVYNVNKSPTLLKANAQACYPYASLLENQHHVIFISHKAERIEEVVDRIAADLTLLSAGKLCVSEHGQLQKVTNESTLDFGESNQNFADLLHSQLGLALGGMSGIFESIGFKKASSGEIKSSTKAADDANITIKEEPTAAEITIGTDVISKKSRPALLRRMSTKSLLPSSYKRSASRSNLGGSNTVASRSEVISNVIPDGKLIKKTFQRQIPDSATRHLAVSKEGFDGFADNFGKSLNTKEFLNEMDIIAKNPDAAKGSVIKFDDQIGSLKYITKSSGPLIFRFDGRIDGKQVTMAVKRYDKGISKQDFELGLTEAKMAGQFGEIEGFSPNCGHFRDENGSLYILSKWLDDSSSTRKISETSMPERLAFIDDIFASGRRIEANDNVLVHADIREPNIMRLEGRPTIIDFDRSFEIKDLSHPLDVFEKHAKGGVESRSPEDGLFEFKYGLDAIYVDALASWKRSVDEDISLYKAYSESPLSNKLSEERFRMVSDRILELRTVPRGSSKSDGYKLRFSLSDKHRAAIVTEFNMEDIEVKGLDDLMSNMVREKVLPLHANKRLVDGFSREWPKDRIDNVSSYDLADAGRKADVPAFAAVAYERLTGYPLFVEAGRGADPLKTCANCFKGISESATPSAVNTQEFLQKQIDAIPDPQTKDILTLLKSAYNHPVKRPTKAQLHASYEQILEKYK